MGNDHAPVPKRRTLKPVVENGPFPPPGLVDRHEACRMFGVSPTTWTAWVRSGRVTCGQLHRRPGDGHSCKLYPIALMSTIDRAYLPGGDPSGIPWDSRR